VCQEAVSFL